MSAIMSSFIIVNQVGNDSPLWFSYYNSFFENLNGLILVPCCSQSSFDLAGGADYLVKISGNCNLYTLQKSS